ncbi:MAG TPA: type II toxin-antitoxin system VapB family antitoxin [Acidothermales bacterium]|jgi:Arc/MetJ family transcription regulator|nr:type II toxin-antitoxin system VapB family antitoxin [Actinomycetes bacterium]
MGRITVDINEEWLDAAQEILGTKTKVATINEALRTFALRRKAAEIAEAFASVEMDFSGSADAWRYGGGRDLSPSRLAENARRSVEEDARRNDVA